MKTSFIKLLLVVCTVLSFTGCAKDNAMKNLNVTAVQTLYEPIDNKSVVLQTSATASVYFEWEPALSEDGALTLYEIAFDKVGGNFSNPLYITAADDNGANTHATITHKQLNKIAALAGIASSATGKLIWTVIASKGINQKIGATSNTLELTRLAGFADVPASVYLTGDATENGTDLSKAIPMKSVGDGMFEVYTKLTAGKTYHFTDANVGTPRTFYTDASTGELKEGTTSCSVSTTGVYRIGLDFSIGASSKVQVTKYEYYFCPLDQFQFSLDYVGNGVWTATSKPINFKQESWGGDQRYKFRMTTVTSTGSTVYEWWGAPASQDSAPSGTDPSYYYIYPASSDQWSDKFKFASEMDGALVDMSIIMNASGSYTHSVTKVGEQ